MEPVEHSQFPMQLQLRITYIYIKAHKYRFLICYGLYETNLWQWRFLFCSFVDPPTPTPPRAAFEAYRSFHARDQIGAVAAHLHHSHINARSEPHLQTSPQLMATLDP